MKYLPRWFNIIFWLFVVATTVWVASIAVILALWIVER